MKKVFFIFLAILGWSVAGYAQSEILLEEPFAESLGSFTLDEQKYPGCTYATMWYVDKSYKHAKVTANQSGSSKGASDCKLISPIVNTEGYAQLALRFEHTTYAANSTSDVDYCMVKVSKDGVNWTKVNIPTWPSKRWGFVACEIDLSAYASSKMQFMFEYVSTASYAGTWEVKNVVLEGVLPTEPPCSYEYLEGQTSTALRESLHKEIKNHTILNYDQVRGDRAKVDVRPDGMLWDIYSACDFDLTMYVPRGYTPTVECDKYNREHMLPVSWWGGSESEPMYTDLHHIVSTDAYANEKRSAWAYDEVKTTNWSNSLGSKFGTGKTWSENSFEPADEYKGDVARVYFYMLTCYMDKNFATGGKGYRYFTYSNGVCNFQTKSLSLMLKWHRQDPVSEREINRNKKVKALQGNDNPFVLEPALVEYIWGTMKGKVYDCEAEVLVPDPGTVDGAITCQEAREKALALSNQSQSSQEYIVVGYVTSLNGSYSTQYGSQTFWVADAPNGGNVFYAYQCYCDDAVVVGDKVSLTGKLLNYNGTPEMKWGQTQVLIPTAIENIEALNLDWQNEDVAIFSITGQNMSMFREQLPEGVYILRSGDLTKKIVIR